MNPRNFLMNSQSSLCACMKRSKDSTSFRLAFSFFHFLFFILSNLNHPDHKTVAKSLTFP